ncbi:Holliday junction branch migration protein RuvA [Candidatus Falkowbacteria bacterium]|nr:Holliday junction branch migration protein RuvA [Candidatus Falkowbacteria bacterium]
MIASLKGQVTYKSPEFKKDSYFVITASGVGYKVYTPLSNLKKVKEGEEVAVFTYLSVAERALDLYGFLDPADKTFFILLLDVPGIGPKSALAILEKTTMAGVQQAIIDDSADALTKMSGLGQKTAEKIIITLKDKLDILALKPKDEKLTASASSDTDVFDALVGFGYTAAEARRALERIDSSISEAGKRLKEALKILGK